MREESLDILRTIHGRHSMAFQDILTTLQNLFPHIKPPALRRLISASHLRSFTDKSEIYREGSYGQTMFLILQGRVELEAIDYNGRRRKLRVLEEGDIFGEAAILGRTRRNVSAKSIGPILLLELEKIRIERLHRSNEGVLEVLEERVTRASVELFLRQHPAFSPLSEHLIQLLVDHSHLRIAERGSTIYENGTAINSIIIIKSGVTKLFRVAAGRTSVLAYYNEGDVAGIGDRTQRSATLQAMGFVEYIEVQAPAFLRVLELTEKERPGWAKQFRKSEVEETSFLLVDIAGESKDKPAATIHGFIEDFVADGAQMAQSLLTIDLDLCIRCGNCTRACEARHGHAKMTRRGKKMTRRRELDTPGSHQPILLPSSCRHCDAPECMIGCPTGAIHRKPSGEVAIHDFCIGCSNCALRCPWHNITMVSTEGRKVSNPANSSESILAPLLASKCDLCADYDGANCVNNCPTQAILRIEPNSYFPELKAAIGTPDPDKALEGGTKTSVERNYSQWIITTITAVCFFVLLGLRFSSDYFSASTVQGGILGILGASFMCLAALLSVRRRLAIYPRRPKKPRPVHAPKLSNRAQLGPFYMWVQAHVAFGVLGLVAALLHSNLQTGGLVTTLLIGFLVLEVLTGLFGVVYYRWMPKVITRLEGEAQVPEDADEELAALITRCREHADNASESLQKFIRKVPRRVGSSLHCLSRNYKSEEKKAQVLTALEPQLHNLEDPDDRATAERLVRDGMRRRELIAMQWLYKIRSGWLVLHVGITAILATFLVLHVSSVFLFGWRFGI